MPRFTSILCASLCIILVSCCPITSQHPLGKPAEAKFDERLAGAWYGGSSEHDKGVFHFGKGTGNETLVLAVEHKPDKAMETATFPVFSHTINKRHYLNIPLATLNIEDVKKYHYTGYITIQYQLSNPDTLVFFEMDEDVLAKAIEEKQIKGKITYDEVKPTDKNAKATKKIDCVSISDTTENLQKYITSEKAKNLFRPYMTLKRVR